MSEDPPRKKRPKPPTPEQMEAERKETRRNGFIALGVLSVLMPTLFFINLMRERHRHDEELGLVALPVSALHKVPVPDVPAVLDNEGELLLTPAGSVKPSRHDVAFSIGAVLPDARACMAHVPAGAMTVAWSVYPDGSAKDVTRATATDAAPRDARANGSSETSETSETAAFGCLEAAVKRTSVAPFDGAPISVRYTFRAK